MMVASTVSRSSEEFIARSTSSNACNSATDRVSSAVRFWSARKVPALVIAIAACSAKVCNNAIWLSVKPPSWPPSEMTPIADPSRITGIDNCAPSHRPYRRVYLGIRLVVSDVGDLLVQNSATGNGFSRWHHGKQRLVIGYRDVIGVTKKVRAQMDQTAIELEQSGTVAVTKFVGMANDQIEYRLWITWRS
jgi:hypothetical protein